MTRKTIHIEVAYALPERQKIIALQVYEGITIQEAVARSGIVRFFPELKLDEASFGIFSQEQSKDYVLRDGDRIEIYRPLIADAKEMRRQRARK
ncbi:RnfH family protein [Rappaport israeli]|uniref:RnfH family protein n=1 Tax=Rappaport israeli TaxID=1839807 RepID=UPI0009318632|nr:RnfH family protein [Rappaport israeli]